MFEEHWESEKIDSTPPNFDLCAASKQWKTIGIRPHHGINLPVFSLKTHKSAGIGEYPDLIPLIDLCHRFHLDVIQLLPLNDTGLDTSPYNALSAIALNPFFIGLADLPHSQSSLALKELYHQLTTLNLEKRVNYKKIRQLKLEYLKEYYHLYHVEIQNSPNYAQFLLENSWVTDYALFRTIKENREWQPWWQWPLELKNRHQKVLEDYAKIHFEQMDFHRFCQYLCSTQMQSVKQYGLQKGIFIKGDIPILLSRDSVDVWKEPHYFYLDFSAGAPPDIYSEEGQFWGFPLYKWKEIEKDHFKWWKQRLAAAEKFYSLYRLDHIVGFFRIWVIAEGFTAKEGHFVPVDKAKWIPQGQKIMQALLESPLLPIGEDLGIVPNPIKNCLTYLGICGTKVMRWEKNWTTDQSFISPDQYPLLSMTTVSTHDSETLPAWWSKFPEEAKSYAQMMGWDYFPLLNPSLQTEILRQSHQSSSLFHINLLQEYLTIFKELSWPNPEDERINTPGTFNDQNWTYRFKPSLEELIEHKGLQDLFEYCLNP